MEDMNDILEYKGYFAKIKYDHTDKILYGKIEGIKDFVNFESESALEIEKEFRQAVDDYIEYCKQKGDIPDRAYKGKFNVRISSELHKKAAMKALEEDKSLNQLVEDAIRDYVGKDKIQAGVGHMVG